MIPIPESARAESLKPHWNLEAWVAGGKKLYDLPDTQEEVNGERFKLCQIVMQTNRGTNFRINWYYGALSLEQKTTLGLDIDGRYLLMDIDILEVDEHKHTSIAKSKVPVVVDNENNLQLIDLKTS